MRVQEYEELFLAESREHIGAINQQLLALEQGGDERDALGAIFRAVHTIKGMSATMGYASAAELSHELEAVLDAIRAEARAFDQEMIDLCFTSVDLLEQSIDAAVGGHDGSVPTAGIVERLRDLATVSIAPQHREPLKVPEGDGLVIRVTLEPNTPLRGVRAFLVVNAARRLGVVEGVAPPMDEIEREQFDREIVLRLRTDATPEDVASAIQRAGDVAVVMVGAERFGAPERESAVATRDSLTPGSVPTVASGRRHVRIDLRRLDSLMNLVGELVIARGRLDQAAAATKDARLVSAVGDASRLIVQLRDEISASRLVPAGQVFDRFPRLVRDVARALSKEVELVIEGGDIEIDRATLDEIADSLVHLLKNAIDHGIETPSERRLAGKPANARLRLVAARDRSAAIVQVVDDGRGINRTRVLAKARERGMIDPGTTTLNDEELIRVLIQPGFSTAESVTEVSGRGVGFDAVNSRVRSLGGAMDVRSTEGRGTSVTLRLPLSLAIVRGIWVQVAHETYALPASHVLEAIELDPEAVVVTDGVEWLQLRDTKVPLYRLRQLVHLPAWPSRPGMPETALVIDLGDRHLAMAVDDVVGQDEIVIKHFDAALGTVALFSGATLRADGSPVLILDASHLLQGSHD